MCLSFTCTVVKLQKSEITLSSLFFCEYSERDYAANCCVIHKWSVAVPHRLMCDQAVLAWDYHTVLAFCSVKKKNVGSAHLHHQSCACQQVQDSAAQTRSRSGVSYEWSSRQNVTLQYGVKVMTSSVDILYFTTEAALPFCNDTRSPNTVLYCISSGRRGMYVDYTETLQTSTCKNRACFQNQVLKWFVRLIVTNTQHWTNVKIDACPLNQQSHYCWCANVFIGCTCHAPPLPLQNSLNLKLVVLKAFSFYQYELCVEVIYVSAPAPQILIPIILVGQVFLIYDFHYASFQTASQLAVKGWSIWGHKMARPEYMSDMGVVEPTKSLLTERLDPALVPDLETAQATGQGSTLSEHEPNTHTFYFLLLHINQQLIGLWHMSKMLVCSGAGGLIYNIKLA